MNNTYSVTNTFPSSTGQTGYTDIGASGIGYSFQYDSSSSIMRVIFRFVSGTYNNLSRAKLELGSVSTLANDPPADFGEELRKCQRYVKRFNNVVFGTGTYGVIGTGNALSSSNIYINIPIPQDMYESTGGSISVSNVSHFDLANGANALSTSSSTLSNATSNYITLLCAVSGATVGAEYIMRVTNANGYILYSREL